MKPSFSAPLEYVLDSLPAEFEALVHLVEDLTECESREDLKGALQRHLADSQWITSAVEEYVGAGDEWLEEFEKLLKKPEQGGRQPCWGVLKEARAVLDAVRYSPEAMQSRSLPITAYMGAGAVPEEVSELRIPASYSISNGRILWLDRETGTKRVVCGNVVLPANEVQTGDGRYVNLHFLDRGTWRSEPVPLREIQESRNVVRVLSDLGCKVSSGQALRMSAYFQQCGTLNEGRTESIETVRILGRHETGEFRLGQGRYDTEGKFHKMQVDPHLGADSTNHIKAFGMRAGSADETWRILQFLCRRWSASFAFLLFGLSSPLLPYVTESEGFTVNMAGNSGTGKTTLQRVLGSCFGPPLTVSGLQAGVIRGWSLTSPAYVSRMLGNLGQGLTCCMDDTKGLKKSPDHKREFFSQMLMDVNNSTSKAGLRSDNTIRDTFCFKLVLSATGEHSMVSFIGDTDGGARNRLVEVLGEPLGGHSDVGKRLSVKLENAVGENYGHVVHYIVRALQSTDQERIRDKWKESQESIWNELDIPHEHDRLSKFYTNALCMGRILGRQLQRTPRQCIEALRENWELHRAVLPRTDPASICLGQLRMYVSQNRNRFWLQTLDPDSGEALWKSAATGDDRNRSPWQWRGVLFGDGARRNHVWLPTREFESLMRELGHDPVMIERSWTKGDEPRCERKRLRVKIPGSFTRSRGVLIRLV